MSGAILQGVPATTLDTHLWIDLPPRQYMKVLRISQSLGARIHANTVVILDDDSMMNFVYEVTGVGSFDAEYKKARWMSWNGLRVAVMPLDRIIKSKQAVGRPKDLAHLPLLKQVLKAQRSLGR